MDTKRVFSLRFSGYQSSNVSPMHNATARVAHTRTCTRRADASGSGGRSPRCRALIGWLGGVKARMTDTGSELLMEGGGGREGREGEGGVILTVYPSNQRSSLGPHSASTLNRAQRCRMTGGSNQRIHFGFINKGPESISIYNVVLTTIGWFDYFGHKHDSTSFLYFFIRYFSYLYFSLSLSVPLDHSILSHCLSLWSLSLSLSPSLSLSLSLYRCYTMCELALCL